MARIYGLNGALRGKQGNNVFSIQNGTQVVKAYQPVVANPRTAAQIDQRLKFSLAGKISSVTPSDAIVGLSGGNKRARRARFVQLITRAAAIAPVNGVSQASIDYGNIFFSEGSLAIYSAITTTTAAFSGPTGRVSVVATVNAMSQATLAANTPAGYGELMICGLFDAATSHLDEIQVQVRTASDATFSFRLGDARSAYVGFWHVPFVPMGGRASFNIEGLAGSGSAVSVDGLIGAFLSGMEFGDSVFVRTIPVLAPSQSASPAHVDDTRKMK